MLGAEVRVNGWGIQAVAHNAADGNGREGSKADRGPAGTRLGSELSLRDRWGADHRGA